MFIEIENNGRIPMWIFFFFFSFSENFDFQSLNESGCLKKIELEKLN